VGGNAFAHESGIHQDGVIKNPLTYEIMTPQSVGLSGSQLTIGKLSGRKGLQGKLRELGYEYDGDALDEIYGPGRRPRRFEEGGHRRRPPRPRRAALVRGPGVGRDRRLERHLVARRERDGSVTLTIGGEERTAEATGNGPVDALFDAVDDALQPVLWLASDADRVRDQGGQRRRGRPGPGPGPLSSFVG
jgi:2-isopropylmalate synthase